MDAGIVLELISGRDEKGGAAMRWLPRTPDVWTDWRFARQHPIVRLDGTGRPAAAKRPTDMTRPKYPAAEA